MLDSVRRRNIASAATDGAFGERTLIKPQKAGEIFASAPDPNRPPYEAVGIYKEATRLARASGEGSRTAENVDNRMSIHGLSYQLSALGGNLPPIKGDHIALLDRDDHPEFRVVFVGPGLPGRITVHLVSAVS